jgi:hypothetical protein
MTPISAIRPPAKAPITGSVKQVGKKAVAPVSPSAPYTQSFNSGFSNDYSYTS